VFSQDFFLRLQELKKIFQMADRDRSGNTWDHIPMNFAPRNGLSFSHQSVV
jgi:hypothetical protein